MTLLAISAPGGERTIFDGELMPESMRPGLEFEYRDGYEHPVAQVGDEEIASDAIARYSSIYEVAEADVESEPDEETEAETEATPTPAIPENLDDLPYRGDEDTGPADSLQDLAQAHDINANQSAEDLRAALAGVRDGGEEGDN